MSGTVGDNLFRASGVIASSASEYDDDVIQSNIAILGFYVAVNGSLVRYNLVDQSIDEFFDTSGVDASASSNEERVAIGSNYYYTGASGTDPTGATSEDTSVSGYTTLVCSAASGSIVVSSTGDVDMLVVAGGGSGGNSYGGGGGAGGLVYKTGHELTAQTYAWVCGAGGTGVSGSVIGTVGADSTWTDAGATVEFTAKGGGYGGHGGGADGGDGGSGGGAGHKTDGKGDEIQSAQSGDSGTYGFGFDGGQGLVAPSHNVGGGGGAGSVGAPGNTSTSGNGGTGKDLSAIFGTAVGDSGWFASGGGGAWVADGNDGVGTASAGGGTSGAEQSISSAAAEALTGGGSGGGSGSNSGAGGSGIILVRFANSAFLTILDLTLQSTDVTAEAEPDYGEFVTLIENGTGTATLNTDIKGYISRDSGTTFTQGTLVDEGTWGTNKQVLGFHDLDISSQPSGTSMCYKITTHNQGASKETRIYATSIGWK